MTAEQFAYWMQGFAELSGDAPPSAEQWKSIREHLATVFAKVTPPFDFSKLGPAAPQTGERPDWQRYAPATPTATPPWTTGGIAKQASDRLRSECAAAEIRTGYARFEPLANGANTI